MYTPSELKELINAIRLGDHHALSMLLDRGASKAPVTETASFTLNAKEHGGRITNISKADGMAVTLPDATGSGMVYAVRVSTTITSNSTTIKAPDADNTFFGWALGVDTDLEGATGYTWNADAGDDTVTMNGSATGGIKGDIWYFTDVAANEWQVLGHITQSGASEVTPFSATVS